MVHPVRDSFLRKVTLAMKVNKLDRREVNLLYTNRELAELRKAIYENATEQLMWQVLYINCVAQHSPSLKVVREKLLSLPRNFELIMLNSVNSPIVVDLAHAVYDGNRVFVQYVDSIFSGGADELILKQKLNDNIQYIASCLHRINPQWKTTEWITLINHQIQLMNTVMTKAKEGHYESWAEILPIIRKLKMDMADYLASGIAGFPQQEG